MAPPDLGPLAGLAVEHAGALERTPGVTGTVGLVVSGTDGEARVVVSVVDGRPTARLDGTEPDCTFTLPRVEALAIAAGTTDPSVAFMRGRLKTAGDNGLVLALLGATAQPRFSAWVDDLARRLDGS